MFGVAFVLPIELCIKICSCKVRITFGCQGKVDFTLINQPPHTPYTRHIQMYIVLLEDKEVRVTKFSPAWFTVQLLI